MEIIIKQPQPDEPESITISCHELTPQLLAIITQLKSEHSLIGGYDDKKFIQLKPDDVYYFESVDNQVFIYGEQKVYRSKYKLYELEENHQHTEFLRISKNTILNLKKIAYVAPAFQGRLEAHLENKEKVIISRQYVGAFKKKLQM